MWRSDGILPHHTILSLVIYTYKKNKLLSQDHIYLAIGKINPSMISNEFVAIWNNLNKQHILHQIIKIHVGNVYSEIYH